MVSFTGRKYLVTGVLNDESIAWHVADALQREGAEVLLSSFGRAARITRKAAQLLPQPPDVLELDVRDDASFEALADEVGRRWGRLDGVVHSIAYAGPDAFGNAFLTTPAGSVLDGFRVSAYSLQQLAGALTPLLARSPHGGSLVGMTVDSHRVLPGYDWMGVFKASLESVAKHLAVYLGPSDIRVNLVAAGPVETVSGRGVGAFDDIARYYELSAPLGWDRTDPARTVGAVLFLLSDLSRYTTGDVVHADGGAHAVVGGIAGRVPATAAPLPTSDETKDEMTPTDSRRDEIGREEFDSRFEEFARQLNDGPSLAGVGGDDNLFDAGVLDSFSVVKLIRLLEQMVGGPIDLTEASIESFATTNLIYRTFVQRSAVTASGASGD